MQRRVLVVEDSAESLAPILTKSGYDTVVARDGEDALSVAWHLLPDTVIFATGYAIVRRLPPSCLRIAIIGLEDLRLLEAADYQFRFIRPLHLPSLLAVLSRSAVPGSPRPRPVLLPEEPPR